MCGSRYGAEVWLPRTVAKTFRGAVVNDMWDVHDVRPLWHKTHERPENQHAAV